MFENFTEADHKKFMMMAHDMRKYGHDPKGQNGAVIINQNKELVYGGYNGLPFEKELNDEMKELFCTNWENNFQNDYRYNQRLIKHAETNAIDNALYHGLKVEDCVIYITLYPCIHCAEAVVKSGIKMLVHDDETVDFNDPNWGEGWKGVKDLFDKQGIEILQLHTNKEQIGLGRLAKLSIHYTDFYRKHGFIRG